MQALSLMLSLLLLIATLLSPSLACFSGDNLVRVLNPAAQHQQHDQHDQHPRVHVGVEQETTTTLLLAMQDLEIGDMVQVDSGLFERVYSFAQYETKHEATYLQLFAANATQGAFHIAADQMVLQLKDKSTASASASASTASTSTASTSTTGGVHHDQQYVPASSIQVGAKLSLMADSSSSDAAARTSTTADTATVTFVQQSTRIGTYCPLTESGTLVVNNVVVSCYSTTTLHPEGIVERMLYGGSRHLSSSSHWMQHKMGAIHRLLPIIDIYNTEDGTNAILSFGNDFVQWWLNLATAPSSSSNSNNNNNSMPRLLMMVAAVLLQLLIAIPIVVCVTVAWWIETLIRMRALIVLTLFVGSLVARCRLCSGTEIELKI